MGRLGLSVGWIEDDNLEEFANDPFTVKRRQANTEEEFRVFCDNNDLESEVAQVNEYLAQDLPFEQRRATPSDIIERMSNGWLVRLEVNGKRLANQEEYANHAVMVSGFNDTIVRLENPDGLY